MVEEENTNQEEEFDYDIYGGGVEYFGRKKSN